MEQYILETDVAFVVRVFAKAFILFRRQIIIHRIIGNEATFFECGNCQDDPVYSQCAKTKSERSRKFLVYNTWHYFKTRYKKKLLERKSKFDLSKMENRCRTNGLTSKGSIGIPAVPLTRETMS
jgi:hypothetical protein